jgi:hypothetical protein
LFVFLAKIFRFSKDGQLHGLTLRNCRTGEEHSIICFRIALELSNTQAASDNLGPAVKKNENAVCILVFLQLSSRLKLMTLSEPVPLFLLKNRVAFAV